jgi:hypothetical protein
MQGETKDDDNGIDIDNYVDDTAAASSNDSDDDHDNVMMSEPPHTPTIHNNRQTGIPFFDTNKVDELLEGKIIWYVFADADTGNPVYFNSKTGERTWQKPNAPYTHVSATMSSGLRGDPEELGADYEKHPYMEPSEEHAIEHARRQIFENGVHPLCRPVNFSSLGTGVKGYFMMLRFLIVMFIVLSLFVTPLIISYSSGKGLGALDSSFGFGKFTLGNIQSSLNRKGHSMAFIWGSEVPLVPDAAEYISWTVFLVAVIFFLGWTSFSIFIQKMAIHEDAATCAINDYTVVVWNLPADACAAEISVHFSDLYNLQHVDWCGRIPPAKHIQKRKGNLEENGDTTFDYKAHPKTRYKRGSIIGHIGARSTMTEDVLQQQKEEEDRLKQLLPNPLYYPTSHCHNIQSNEYLNMWICDLCVGHPNGHLIRSFNEHAELVTQLRIQRALYKRYRSLDDGGVEPNDDLADKAWITLQRIEEELVQLSQIHKRGQRRDPEDVINAYVTFNNQESFRRCYEDYANTRRTCCSWKKSPLPLLFNGDHHLKVDRAPDPSDILWENLEATEIDIMKKRCMTRCTTGSLLLFCFAVVFTAFYYANEFSTLINNALICQIMLPSIHYNVSRASRKEIEQNYFNIGTIAGSDDSSGSNLPTYNTSNATYPTLQRHSDASVQRERDKNCQAIDSINFLNSKSSTNSLYYDVRYTNDWKLMDKKNKNFVAPIYNISTCKKDWCSGNSENDQKCPCIEVSEDISKSKSMKSCYWQNGTGNVGWNGRDVQNCYCSSHLTLYLNDGGSLANYILAERLKVEGSRAIATDERNANGDNVSDPNSSIGSGFCSRFAYLFALSRGLMVLSVSMVSVLNVLLEEIVKVVSTWEHAHTLSAQSAAIMSKVFIGIYLNTAFILIVVNQKWPGIQTISRGSYDGFTSEWYGKIGASLTLTMLMDVVVPHIIPTLTIFIVKPLLRRVTKLLSPRFMTPM